MLETRDFSQRMVLKGLSTATDPIGTQGMTLNYDGYHADMANRLRSMDEEELINEEDDMMVEEFDFIGDNHNEEYVKVHNYGGQDSYSIIPYNNVQPHDPDSQDYEDDDLNEDISIEENKKTIVSKQSLQQLEDSEVDENDPCVQNARLLEKYAHMLGAGNGEEGYDEENHEDHMRMMLENGEDINADEMVLDEEYDQNEYGEEYEFEQQ